MKTILFLSLTFLLVLTNSSRHLEGNHYNLMSHRKLNDLCKNWDEDMSQCIECYEGCTKWENICVKIVKYCEMWDDMGNCVQCEKGYGSDTGMSINGTCPKQQDNALTSMPENVTDINCQCHNDERECIYCYAGFYLDIGNFCVELPENCTAADPLGDCTACEAGFVVENGTCV
jgi:hypothetical protein